LQLATSLTPPRILGLKTASNNLGDNSEQKKSKKSTHTAQVFCFFVVSECQSPSAFLFCFIFVHLSPAVPQSVEQSYQTVLTTAIVMSQFESTKEAKYNPKDLEIFRKDITSYGLEVQKFSRKGTPAARTLLLHIEPLELAWVGNVSSEELNNVLHVVHEN
jgi:tRNA U34 5-methylaminomethyl-2-thiouridine-forming methyltransferase MnmC